MDNATHWSVDRLAASNLLTQLKLDASDELIDLVTRHFAEHRRSLVSWAAERTQSAIFEAMESASISLLADRDEAWARGFHHAEEMIFALDPGALLELDSGPPRSKGQFLRSMVRQARQR